MFIGACTFYEWWMFRSCEPFAFSCTCGNTLLIYSMIFYSIGMIVAVPISLYIIFTICTKIPSFYKKVSCLYLCKVKYLECIITQ